MCGEKLYKLYRFSAIDAVNSDLTTAQLAERTGLPAGTLRMWESRHGFPAPARLPSGHRRYSDDDVAQVLDVLRLREQGLSLGAAIDRARNQRPRTASSVFAGLRARRPDVAPIVLAKPAVLALTRAIEDEYCATAAEGLLIGSFQRERHYRGAQSRWRELARTARLAVAVADFTDLRDAPDTPVEVPIGSRHALSREWALVISADTLQACLAGWEQLGPEPHTDSDRRFEVLWSFDPAVVADAVTVAAELVESLHPGLAQRIAIAAGAPPLRPEAALDAGGALAQRMTGYLGRLLDGAGAAAPA